MDAVSDAIRKDKNRPLKLLIFDLDGTLIDSRLDLANSVNAARRYLDMPPLPNETVYSYVGNGVDALIKRSMGDGASERELARAKEFFLDYYRAHMLDFTTLYPCTTESLERLAAAGIELAILTNKPVRFSTAIAEGLGIAPLFRHIYGGNSFEQKKPHPVGIETLCKETGASRDECVMVGDSAVDVQTARNAGVPVWGVSYGFQPESFALHPPDWLGHSMAEIADKALAR